MRMKGLNTGFSFMNPVRKILSMSSFPLSVSAIKRSSGCRLRAWSVEQNARDTQMTTRVTEGPRRERLPPSFLASRGFAAQRVRARALPLLNLKKKRHCSQSILGAFRVSGSRLIQGPRQTQELK